MIILNEVKLPLNTDFENLKPVLIKLTGLSEKQILSYRMIKKSVDARRKDDVHFICRIAMECSLEDRKALKLIRYKNAKEYTTPVYHQKRAELRGRPRPVVAGSGPAGLFAALNLAKAGLRPILLERGQDVDRRIETVERFWSSGVLDPGTNVQFGEGGAGTFSDGKLNTGTKDDRQYVVLKTFARHGAPEEIMYQAKPHIGTDRLTGVVKNIRAEIIEHGGEVWFEHCLKSLEIENNSLRGVCVQAGRKALELECDTLILAAGHSARDTYEMLYNAKVNLSAKPFSIGLRIEHPQSMIDRVQYGKFAGHPSLSAADYKMAVHLEDGRGVYTFCMCPGGLVVASSSERNRVVTNGMSLYARDAENANSALLVGVSPDDYGSGEPLAGIWLQRQIENSAFTLGGGDYSAPAQLVGDFLMGRPSSSLGSVRPSYRPNIKLCSIAECLPAYITEALQRGILEMDKRLPGFAMQDAVLTAPETRSSSPVRVLRDDTMQSSVTGIYPCGEGSGYAGGIVSSAVDGLKASEMVIRKYSDTF